MHYNSFNGTLIMTNASQWASLPGPASLAAAEVVIYASWTSDTVAIQSMNWGAGSLLITPALQTQWFGASGNRYYFQNVADASYLSSGQFFFANGPLVYKELPGESVSSSGLIVPRLISVLTLTGNDSAGQYVSNVRFSGLTFAHAGSSMQACIAADGCQGQSAADTSTAAVHLIGAQNVVFDNVTVRNTGDGYGLWIDEGSDFVTVQWSTFTDLGSGGVRVGVSASDVPNPPDSVTNIVVTDSTLSFGGNIIEAGCGLLSQQANDSTYQYLDIHDFRYTGISVGWDWTYSVIQASANNTVFKNNISNIFLGELSDGGCVYHLGDSSHDSSLATGTKIINNLCTNVASYGYGGWTYYLDLDSTFVTVQKNVAYSVKMGYHQHYGYSNVFNVRGAE